ncbi:MAG: hypothetical protein L0H41_03110 [Microlunatus sp.]|nr:hypothetical protein [Microlunatus sp.]MDN5770447.1 hypothetical protein [Microlunatus sp.]
MLWVSGVESETELAFSALYDLLNPIIADRVVLPPAQSAALASALALTPVVPGDRLAVCVATLGLLQHTASDTPLLVLVDDLPWLDSASRECVVFATVTRPLDGHVQSVIPGVAHHRGPGRPES